MDLKFARERCKVIFAFYANNFIFYSVLNTLYQSLIKIRAGKMGGLRFLRKELYFLQR